MLLEMNGAGIGHEGLYVTSLLDHTMGWRERADEFPDTLKIASIFSRYTLDRYGGHFYAKAQNLRRRVRAGYDAVLATHDLLLLPTVPMKATPIPGKDATPQEITRRSWEPTRNTCPFNVTGHPGDQRAMRDGGRPAHRAYAGWPALRRGDDLSRRRRIRAVWRLDDLLTRRAGNDGGGQTPRDERLWPFAEIGG